VFSGRVEVTDAASIRMPVVGMISYCKGGCTACQSQQHLLTMTRQ